MKIVLGSRDQWFGSLASLSACIIWLWLLHRYRYPDIFHPINIFATVALSFCYCTFLVEIERFPYRRKRLLALYDLCWIALALFGAATVGWNYLEKDASVWVEAHTRIVNERESDLRRIARAASQLPAQRGPATAVEAQLIEEFVEASEGSILPMLEQDSALLSEATLSVDYERRRLEVLQATAALLKSRGALNGVQDRLAQSRPPLSWYFFGVFSLALGLGARLVKAAYDFQDSLDRYVCEPAVKES